MEKKYDIRISDNFFLNNKIIIKCLDTFEFFHKLLPKSKEKIIIMKSLFLTR